MNSKKILWIFTWYLKLSNAAFGHLLLRKRDYYRITVTESTLKTFLKKTCFERVASFISI